MPCGHFAGGLCSLFSFEEKSGYFEERSGGGNAVREIGGTGGQNDCLVLDCFVNDVGLQLLQSEEQWCKNVRKGS